MRGRFSLSLFFVLLSLCAPLAAQQLEEKRFDLRKDGEEILRFAVDAAGTVRVKARVREPLANAPVRLVLIDPDGLEIVKKGNGPLKLHYTIEDAEQFGEWTLIVHNVGKMARLTGNVEVVFEPRPTRSVPSASPTPVASASSEASADETETVAPRSLKRTVEPRSSEPITDGEIRDGRRFRAACRGRNEEVEVRVDLESGSAGLYLSYHRFADLQVSASGELIELHGGEQPLFLDREKKALFFADAGKPFCKVKIFPY